MFIPEESCDTVNTLIANLCMKEFKDKKGFYTKFGSDDVIIIYDIITCQQLWCNALLSRQYPPASADTLRVLIKLIGPLLFVLQKLILTIG